MLFELVATPLRGEESYCDQSALSETNPLSLHLCARPAPDGGEQVVNRELAYSLEWRAVVVVEETKATIIEKA